MPKMQRSRFTHMLLAYLAAMKWSLLLAIGGTLTLAAADLLRPWPLKIILDNILLDKALRPSVAFLQEPFAQHKALSVVVVSCTIIVISVVRSLSSYTQMSITSRLGFQFAHMLRRELFIHMQRMSLAFHKRTEMGELTTRLTSDTRDVREIFSDFVLNFVSESAIIIGMVSVMLVMNWRLSLIILATFPVLVFLCFYRYLKIRDSVRRQRRAEGKIASRLSEVLHAMSVVQAFGRESYEEQRFTTQSAETLAESLRTARLEAAAAHGVDLVTAVGTSAVILFGALQTLNGQLTPGDIVVFASYMGSLYGPVRSLAKFSSKFSRTAVSAQRLAEFLDMEPEMSDRPDAIDATHLRGEITFQDVSFAYDDGKAVLSQVSFTVQAGEHVALLGPSGAGKSTIAALLLRFYEAQQGAITIDGVDIRHYKRDALRSQIGVLLQEAMLFGASIKENIAYGKLEATMDDIVAAAQVANAHDFIMALDNGYDTIVGERGGTLSGGQRQRLAIARTFVRDVPILILDEPMTGLDAASEMAVREALQRLMAGRTCLLITHDLQAARDVDRILLLDDGHIVEQGPPDVLMTSSCRYRELYARKFRHTAAPEGAGAARNTGAELL